MFIRIAAPPQRPNQGSVGRRFRQSCARFQVSRCIIAVYAASKGEGNLEEISSSWSTCNRSRHFGMRTYFNGAIT
jgi:hypothetical protein